MSATVPISSITIGNRHRRDMGDLRGLANSIAEVGLLHPIGALASGELVFGERRLRACRDLLGWTEIPARIVNISSIVEGEIHENQIRKDFTPSERVAIERTIKAQIERRQGARTDLGQNIGRSRVADAPARLAGFGNRETARQASPSSRPPSGNPRSTHSWWKDMDRSGRVGGVYRRLVVAQKAAAIAAEPPPLPRGPFPESWRTRPGSMRATTMRPIVGRAHTRL